MVEQAAQELELYPLLAAGGPGVGARSRGRGVGLTGSSRKDLLEALKMRSLKASEG